MIKGEKETTSGVSAEFCPMQFEEEKTGKIIKAEGAPTLDVYSGNIEEQVEEIFKDGYMTITIIDPKAIDKASDKKAQGRGE